MLEGSVLYAFGLTLFAGLSTGIGSALAFFSHHTNTRFLATALGLSAGVMIYVSFVEIMVKAHDALANVMTEPAASWATTAGFFGGILVMAALDRLPALESGNPHELRLIEEMSEEAQRQRRLLRMGLFSAAAIAIHNFPEGLATFLSALDDPQLGTSIAIAIAIHNVPEGIAVAVPIYFATADRGRAFRLSFLSGLSEPLGAVIGYFLLMPFMNDAVFGVVFASVAGVMVFISLDELLPAAEQYGEHHAAIYGLIAGMAIMATSLLLLL